MKKAFLTALVVLFSLSLFAQDGPKADTLRGIRGWFHHLRDKRTIVVHDTIYIITENYQEDEETESEELEEEFVGADQGSIPMPFDTLNTHDKYQKVILFDNGSWIYYDIPKPDLPDFISNDHWMTESVHAYMDINVKDLPEELDLVLCDSVHGWHIPGYGVLVSPYKIRKGHKHQGVDIGIPWGEPVYAAFDGIVRVALPTKYTGGYGNVVVLRHANGLETYYGHLSSYIVETDDIVKAGEIIGYCGSTGRSSGPHLHFETRYQGQSFDPERIINFQDGTLRDTIFTLKKHYFSIYSHEGQSDKESEVASQQVPPTTPKHVTYVVKKGDTLSSIAKKHGTTVDKICKLNNISKTKTLKIGQKLTVK